MDSSRNHSDCSYREPKTQTNNRRPLQVSPLLLSDTEAVPGSAGNVISSFRRAQELLPSRACYLIYLTYIKVQEKEANTASWKQIYLGFQMSISQALQNESAQGPTSVTLQHTHALVWLTGKSSTSAFKKRPQELLLTVL